MTIFLSEAELIEVLDRADAMINACAEGLLDFNVFYRDLGYLHGFHALDGHESDEEELRMLDKHHDRIAWIERVLDEISGVCADQDSTKESYINAGRFGTAEALRRLKVLVENRSAK